METKTNKEKAGCGLVWLNRFLTAAGFAVCLLFVCYGIREGLFASREVMVRFLEGFGVLGPVMFVIIQVVQVVVPVLPGGISCLAGVLLFGPLYGFVYNYVGICIGSAFAFQIARKLGMPVVERAAGGRKMGKYLAWMENGSFDKFFAAAIFLPVAPDDLLCFLAGITSMSFRRFLCILILGKPLSIAAYSMGLHFVFENLLKLLQ